MRELAKDFDVDVKTTPFLTDNESCVKLHSDFYSCKKSKHILRAIATLRRCVQELIYSIHHIYGSTNWSDLLTKPLQGRTFTEFRDAVQHGKVIIPPLKTTTAKGARAFAQYVLSW